MKLRIQGQEIRVRLGECEAGQLLGGEELTDATLTPFGAWRRQLALGDAAGLSMPAPGTWRLLLPAAEFRAFAAQRPRRDGLALDFGAAGPADLHVVVEIDARESRRHQLAAPIAS